MVSVFVMQLKLCYPVGSDQAHVLIKLNLVGDG